MSSLSSGGGGGSIYQDGDPVSEQLGSGESLTVPDGETWVVDIGGWSKSGGDPVAINGTAPLYPGNNNSSRMEQQDLRTVLKSGDTVSNGSSINAQIGGWSV